MIRIALTTDIAACRALRRAVFIEEQGVSEADELDDLDDQALHVMATLAGRPVGCARMLIQGEIGKIGRVCVLADERGTGLGSALIHAAVEHLRALPGITKVKLGAQTHALGFYAKLGFSPEGEVYLDAGIPHRNMVLAL